MHFTYRCKFSCNKQNKHRSICKTERCNIQNVVSSCTSISTHFSMSSVTIYS